jgi:hypothetical protein
MTRHYCRNSGWHSKKTLRPEQYTKVGSKERFSRSGGEKIGGRMNAMNCSDFGSQE